MPSFSFVFGQAMCEIREIFYKFMRCGWNFPQHFPTAACLRENFRTFLGVMFEIPETFAKSMRGRSNFLRLSQHLRWACPVYMEIDIDLTEWFSHYA